MKKPEERPEERRAKGPRESDRPPLPRASGAQTGETEWALQYRQPPAPTVTRARLDCRAPQPECPSSRSDGETEVSDEAQ